MTKNYLLCYDIFDDKRLYKVRKTSYSFALGGQKSALEMPLTAKEIDILIDNLKQKIAPEDKVNLIEVEGYPLFIGKTIEVLFEEGMIIV